MRTWSFMSDSWVFTKALREMAARLAAEKLILEGERDGFVEGLIQFSADEKLFMLNLGPHEQAMIAVLISGGMQRLGGSYAKVVLEYARVHRKLDKLARCGQIADERLAALWRLLESTGHAGHGWDFPEGIREMDMMMIKRGMSGAAEHEKRVEVTLAYWHAFERENPDIDISDITPHMWAMAVFVMFHAVMREDGGFADASTIAAEYGLKHDQSAVNITWCCDWALQQAMARRFRSKHQ
jgi:hypothetical protein